MNTENEMNEEVRQLLDSLEEHGKNARRQKELGDLIDRLADEEKAVAMPHKHRTLTPLWWAMGAAAACLLLWLLVKPNAKQQPEMEQEILVEETKTVDSVKTEVNDAVFEQPVANETYLAEETPVVPQNAPMKKERPKTQIIEEVVEQPILAEVKPTEPKDTTNIGSNTIPTENETPSAVQKPQRRLKTKRLQPFKSRSGESSGASTWCATNARRTPNPSPNLSWKTEPYSVSRKTRT